MLTQSMIEQMAVNDSAFSNGKKLADKGSFTELKRTEDAKVYWALCAGSGKNPYKTSVDMSDESKLPVCRCSCPSRQFPCKHGIALMLLIANGEQFAVDALPQDIADKHAKAEEREAKKAQKEAQPKKVTAASIKAAEKKIEKQLEGLALSRQLIDELMTAGLATLSGTSLQKFRDLATELYNYGLPGPQLIINRIAQWLEPLQSGTLSDEKSRAMYSGALRQLIRLNTIIKKGTAFLSQKLSDKDFSCSDDVLFEELGGIWKLEDLKKLGSCQENARLVELAFESVEDDVKDEIQQKSYYVNLDTKEICVFNNMVPKKLRSKIKASDSCFDMVQVPLMLKYPGTDRVRWDNFTTAKITQAERDTLATCAEESFESALKKFKNYIKNTLHEKELMLLLPVASIGSCNGAHYITDAAGMQLRLSVPEAAEAELERVFGFLPVALENVCAAFGKMFYSEAENDVRFELYSLLTKAEIIRLF